MRRVVVGVLLVLGGIVAVDAMGDMFQTRGDRVPADSRSEITFELALNGYKHDPDVGARNLVAACEGRTASQVLGEPAPTEEAGGAYVFSVEPALGPENTRKLVGCLEDFTVDHLRADVVAVDRRD